MADSTPPQTEHFDWNSLPEPEAIAWPIYPEDSPAYSDGENKQAFNEDAARAAFGDACIDQLLNEQERFRGDWWILALLLRCEAHAERIDPAREDNGRFGLLSIIRDFHRENGVTLHMERANLSGTHLEHANLEWSHFENADLSRTHFEHANFTWSHLKHAVLSGATLDHANLAWSRLGDASLYYASLENADLHGARLDHARLIGACIKNTNLDGANLEYANISDARLERANMHRANLDHATVREATGILFDDNAVQRLDIEGGAKDPWSVLRRKYTGPMFFVHLLLVVAFVLPYAGKVLALTVTDRVYAGIRASLEAGAEAPAGAEVVRSWLEHFDTAHTQTPAWWALLGGAQALWWVFVPTAAIILIYNALRGFLTLRVGILRDQADRVLRTPTLEEYYGPGHPLAGDDAGWRRILPVWKRRMAQWHKAEDAERPWHWRWVNRSMLSPLNAIGLYRLHSIASVLFWITLASVGFHIGAWLLTTTVPVPN
ncbi:MAG: pentapeptide repeat-containing protein [Phycisphaerales bacterium]|nr:pentapeptide repeat-containing protein [Phycisphaerales bacterium]